MENAILALNVARLIFTRSSRERLTRESSVMKQTEIKRMLPSRSENNPENGEKWEDAREGVESKIRVLPFAQLKFPFLFSAVGFVFLLSIRDRGIKGTLCRCNNNSPLKKRFHCNESQDLNRSLR